MMRKGNEFIKFINDTAQLCIKLIALSAVFVTVMAWMWIGMMLLSAWFEVNAGTVWVAITAMSIVATLIVVVGRRYLNRKSSKGRQNNAGK
ncbi:MAG: hypothetical protein SOR93_03565 [Clostridiales Family XIII bacterium]|uniref:hypothetical protein n=1 Tax=Hominibacterium faecale TaxID=2839743 RepID=UPI0022B29B06|nr:hypothetical protein [Hominibacterium faecale]MCI7301848.1 hypothetical protein [Clostridia bacterium]MDY3010325.1 hypothetical protein [Clostridiales Family XIII bacterium]